MNSEALSWHNSCAAHSRLGSLKVEREVEDAASDTYLIGCSDHNQWASGYPQKNLIIKFYSAYQFSYML